MNRRTALALLGTSVGALAGAGIYGRHAFLPPGPSEPLESVQDLAVRLVDSLDPHIREQACVEYDHPLRQYHNRGVRGGGIGITSGRFSRAQRGILTDLMYAGLSEQGRERLPEQFYISWPGVHLLNLLVCGDPAAGPWQIILSGPHLNLRLGGRSREGVAFGGPQVYGDQRGDYSQGLPGNVYRYQFEIARRLFQGLDASRRRAAVIERAPVQTQIDLQGSDGEFAGVRTGDLSMAGRRAVGDLVDGILSTYHPDEAAYALECLDGNGGIESLHLSYYERSEDGRSFDCQIFRLEGPAAVFHFRGFPHVHAFINVGMNGDEPLSVGDVIFENPAVLQGRQVKRLFEDAMRDRARTDFAYYDEQSVAGRLRAGVIRTGDIYCLESWQDHVTVVEIEGSRIGGVLLDELRAAGIDLAPRTVYTVATTGQVAGEMAREALGAVSSSKREGLLRDAAVAYLKGRASTGEPTSPGTPS